MALIAPAADVNMDTIPLAMTELRLQTSIRTIASFKKARGRAGRAPAGRERSEGLRARRTGNRRAWSPPMYTSEAGFQHQKAPNSSKRRCAGSHTSSRIARTHHAKSVRAIPKISARTTLLEKSTRHVGRWFTAARLTLHCTPFALGSGRARALIRRELTVSRS